MVLVPLELRNTENLIEKVRIKLAEIEFDSVVNGVGIRTVLYTQGCSHHCTGCHNPSTWDYSGGKSYKYSEILSELNKNKLSKSITWSGGDPVYQENSVYIISKELQKLGYNIWLYTGFEYEYLLKFKPLILNCIDVLVDGLFDINKKTLDKPFVGSYNQRVIDVKNSLKSGKVIELKFD